MSSGIHLRQFYRSLHRKSSLKFCRCASTSATVTPAPSLEYPDISVLHYPPTQPPSFKQPGFRKSQLHRQYTSLLRSTPLILLFQHNNLRSTEWVGIRRELLLALRKVDEKHSAEGKEDNDLANYIKLQIIHTGIFESALRVVEYWRPSNRGEPLEFPSTTHPAKMSEESWTHSLSTQAHDDVASKKNTLPLSPLLAGPIALLTFPTVSPQHLKAALSILAPKAPDFPAPTRRVNPGYHDPLVQGGLTKLLLLGARVEGQVFDIEGTRWVGKINGGVDGLRAQVVTLLQKVGGSDLIQTLETAGRSLWMTMEGRKEMLEKRSSE